MGKVTYGMNVSVDGYIADTNGTSGGASRTPIMHQYWNDQIRDTAVSLYGRKLYELMSAHWPTADEAPDVSSVQAEFARLWRAMPKVVFSKTLDSVGWNSRLERGDVVEIATRLKAETDGLIEVAGATLAAPLVRAGLVDEFHVVVTPRRGRRRHAVLPDAGQVDHAGAGGEPHVSVGRGPPPLRLAELGDGDGAAHAIATEDEIDFDTFAGASIAPAP